MLLHLSGLEHERLWQSIHYYWMNQKMFNVHVLLTNEFSRFSLLASAPVLITTSFIFHYSNKRVRSSLWKKLFSTLCVWLRELFVSPLKDMTMEEVREYERATQEATNKKLGTFPPAISISETPLPSCAHSGPSSAPSTPLSTEAPDFLSVPKDRPRKKSAPETLTLSDPARRDSSYWLPNLFSWGSSSRQPEWPTQGRAQVQ